MMKFFLILLYILLFVLALVLWIIICPRSFWIEFDKKDSLVVKMRIFLFKIRLFPLPSFLVKKGEKSAEAAAKDAEKAAKKAAKKEAAQSKKAADRREERGGPLADIQFSFGLIKQALEAVGRIMKRILHSFKIRDVSFTIPVYDEDPHKLQKKFANITSAFYSLNTCLEQVFRLTYKAPQFVPDFAGRYSDSLYFYCQITASPFLLVVRGLYALRQYLKIKKENKKVIKEA